MSFGRFSCQLTRLYLNRGCFRIYSALVAVDISSDRDAALADNGDTITALADNANLTRLACALRNATTIFAADAKQPNGFASETILHDNQDSYCVSMYPYITLVNWPRRNAVFSFSFRGPQKNDISKTFFRYNKGRMDYICKLSRRWLFFYDMALRLAVNYFVVVYYRGLRCYFLSSLSNYVII